ncbi:DUF3592 domain-containing protein [Aliikangiella coralliicola]|uniref:DUF3592 domain-containing protein n=1 Tax=Aliikangiella coralliicola TaxID=2592383 RepID=A0A545UC31_9GAMM|nr:DUF3592 domain-containing protein [Aliikangiella coralliicola]TQV87022.1 DUF3592 domain-containing protein [Aliikangiella coralliicola]
MSSSFVKIVTGRSVYSISFLLIFMLVAPLAFFTEYEWLDSVAWCMATILGFFIFATGVITLKEAKDSPTWPKAEARLISSSLTWHTSNGSKRYAPKIHCQFRVGEQDYSGTEYDFSASYTKKSEAEEKLKLVKAMQPFWVFYKPGDPSVNVIQPGIHSVHFARMVIGAVGTVVSILSWAGVIKYF